METNLERQISVSSAVSTDALLKGKLTSSRRVDQEHSTTGGWNSAVRVLVNVIADTMTFFAIVSNLVTYMVTDLHLAVPQAAKNLNNWVGSVFLIPLLGGFVADSYWGQYRTVATGCTFYLLGLGVLTLGVSLKSLKPPPCAPGSPTCSSASKEQLGVVFLGLYLTAIGSGTVKPCIISFGADQFDESRTESKISFFNMVVWGINVGGLLAVTVLVYLQDNVGWGWGFGTLIIAVFICVVVFFLGHKTYRYSTPKGSPLTKLAQVFVAAALKWRLDISKDHNSNKFLDRAAIPSKEDESLLNAGTKPSPWKLCSEQQVKDTKLVVKMLPIWLATVWFATTPAQSASLFLRQGSAMNNKLGTFKVPPASMLLFNNLTVILFLPFYDRVFVPVARKLTKNTRGISLLQRIGFGMLLGILTTVAAARVETMRKNSKEALTIFWLLPQYVIIGLAEAFTNTGLLEFFYDQAPSAMHSLGTSFSFASLGVGSFLSSFLITVVNRLTESSGGWIQNNLDKGHLEDFYWLLAGLSSVNLTIFVLIARWYKYKPHANPLVTPSVIVV